MVLRKFIQYSNPFIQTPIQFIVYKYCSIVVYKLYYASACNFAYY